MKPRGLRAGDRIRLVSPASPVSEEKLQAATTWLESQGYEVELSEHALEANGHLAGSDEHRAADLMAAFEDPDVACVFCTRGGYGCARLFPYLDLDRMAARGKLFAGFSDVTTLHVALNKRGLATLHAPMALTLSVEREPWVWQSLASALAGADPILKEAPKGETVRGGVAEGSVVGGCLCLLADTLGTPNALDARGKILLLEDVDESPHRVDAMLTHLLNARALDGVAGIVVGEMTRTDEKLDTGIGGKPWREIVTERLSGVDAPMIVGYPFGHAPNALSLPLGIRARLDADAGALQYLETLCD
jgi:muramoyltetrapeptide carboxypeptidase